MLPSTFSQSLLLHTNPRAPQVSSWAFLALSILPTPPTLRQCVRAITICCGRWLSFVYNQTVVSVARVFYPNLPHTPTLDADIENVDIWCYMKGMCAYVVGSRNNLPRFCPDIPVFRQNTTKFFPTLTRRLCEHSFVRRHHCVGGRSTPPCFSST